jgi:general secretion pathway protein K
MRTALTRYLHAREGREGFIIVAVLWMLAALATLAAIFSVYVINTATAFTVHDERLQAEGLTRAALELTAYQGSVNPQAVPTRGSFVFRIGNAQVTTEFVSETARIDLNSAPKELLTGLFATLGAQRSAADGYADRIIAWRTTPAPNTTDDEASLYRAAGLRYAPRGGPFMHVGELSLVLGIPEAMVERALPFLTIYSGRAQVNVRDAAPQVLSALPGMSPQLLYAVLAQRDTAPQNGEGLLAMLGPAQALATIQGSKAMRVTARIAFDSGQRMTTEAVIFLLDSGTEPYRVLTWRDDIDGAPVDARVAAR